MTPSPQQVGTDPTTAHCTIVVVDIKGFGHRSRTNINQVRVRRGLYRALERSFGMSGIPWETCEVKDRGDGVLVLAPATIPKALFVNHLPDTLVGALTEHNAMHPLEERIRLRLALHAGEITYDEHGVTARSITHTCRLIESAALHARLARAAATLAIISSDWFYDEVVRQSEHSAARTYRPVNVTHKETTARAWIRMLKAPSVRRN